jgi:hypothetical protein
MNNRIKMTDSKFKCNIFLFLSVTVFMARLSIDIPYLFPHHTCTQRGVCFQHHTSTEHNIFDKELTAYDDKQNAFPFSCMTNASHIATKTDAIVCSLYIT